MIFNIYFQRSHSNPTWWAVIEIFSFGFSYLLFYSFWKVLGRPDFQGASDMEIDWPDIFRCIGWSTWASLGTSLKTLCGWSKIQIHRIYSEFHWWYILTMYRIYSAASTTSSSESQDSVTLFRITNQFFIDAIIRSSFARAPNFVTVNRKLCFVFWIQRICDLEMWDWDSQFVNDTALSFAILHLYYLSSSCLGEILVTITQSVGFGFPAGYIAWSKSAATLSIDWKFQHLTIPGTIAIFL